MRGMLRLRICYTMNGSDPAALRYSVRVALENTPGAAVSSGIRSTRIRSGVNATRTLLCAKRDHAAVLSQRY